MNTNKSAARVNRPERYQVEMQFYSLDQLLPADHRARVVWQFVESLNLDSLYERIEVVEGQPGRNAIAPEILVALWLLATLDGIGSAREVARRCETDIAYRWICGSVGVNHHALSDFRVDHLEFLERVLTDSVASLVDRGLVPLETIAQDGMRVRANAGSSSYRTKPTLEKLQQQARDHLNRLQQESESESARQEGEARRRAARERAARERKDRLDEALEQLEKLAEQREKRKKGDGKTTRCSTTDPDARRMKMANGGYDLAYNVQFATDAETRIIVGVDVTNQGTDGAELAPMHDKICSQYGKAPDHVLADRAFATKQGVTAVEARGTKVISSVPRSNQLRRHGKDPHARQPGDTEEYADFRQRMAEQRYQELYKTRPSVAEFPNASCRNRNLRQFPVRGQLKAKAVALWHAIAFNLQRMLNLKILET